MKDRTVAITRLFDAPRERVFAAWTRAEYLAHWFGPRRFTVPSCSWAQTVDRLDAHLTPKP